jgi:hypothetical protein
MAKSELHCDNWHVSVMFSVWNLSFLYLLLKVIVGYINRAINDNPSGTPGLFTSFKWRFTIIEVWGVKCSSDVNGCDSLYCSSLLFYFFFIFRHSIMRRDRNVWCFDILINSTRLMLTSINKRQIQIQKTNMIYIYNLI